MKFATKLIHAGIHPDPETGAIMTPIYQTSTYVQKSPGNHKGYEYSRTHNPTRTQLQNNLAAIECGKWALCFSSGMGAIDSIIKLLNPGDEIIASNDLYGGTYRIFTKIFEKFNLKFHFTDLSKTDNLNKLINSNTKMVWIETPTNPMLNISDIEALTAICKKNNIISVVDNTFASPYLQNPLLLGADLVMHSATKYINGHSDVVMGAVIGNDDSLHEKLAFIQNSCGAVPGPQDCFLVLRGLKTLHVRMERHCFNGKRIAEFLKTHPKVDKVYYPGFETHNNHEIAKKQMKDFGGMVSFTLKNDSVENAHRFLSATKLFSLAESLGGVESLCGHPATMTHASIPREERIKSGLLDSLIRLSSGIEDCDDLISDINYALNNS
ncbi:MAG: cystathionine gamma-synthase [Bacteroidia bacterium]|nr:cystathionine gamma-synthase [Bacteroidia bacterium]